MIGLRHLLQVEEQEKHETVPQLEQQTPEARGQWFFLPKSNPGWSHLLIFVGQCRWCLEMTGWSCYWICSCNDILQILYRPCCSRLFQDMGGLRHLLQVPQPTEPEGSEEKAPQTWGQWLPVSVEPHKSWHTAMFGTQWLLESHQLQLTHSVNELQYCKVFAC